MKMNTNNFSATKDQLPGDHVGNFGVSISRYLRYWPFFLLSILFCLGLGYLYLKFSVPLFTVKAKLLINDERDSRKIEKGNDVAESSKRVDDEIAILTSRTLMGKVVRDLELWIQYRKPGRYNDVDLYASTPVYFSLVEPLTIESGHVLTLTIINSRQFVLKQQHSSTVFDFNTVLKSNWGKWRLTPTSDLSKYIGQTILIQINNPEKVIDNYLERFAALMAGEQSAIAELRIIETEPERGIDIVNNLIKAYNFASIEHKNKISQSTFNFLDDRLTAITSELNYVEKRVESYKSSRGITNLTSESQFYLDNVKNNDSKLNEVNVQLQVIDEIQRYIDSPVSPGSAPVTAGISDPGLTALVNQLIQLELQKDKLLANTPEYNPVFAPLNRQIKSTKNAIYANITGIKRSLITTRNQLQKYNSGFESSIKKLPGQEREYINIKRQQSIKEELYIYLLQKREEAGLSNSSQLLESRIVDEAHHGDAQLPSTAITYALATIFGLIFPGAIIFARHAFDNRVNDVQEIEEGVLVPFLGELAFQKSVSPKYILAGSSSRTRIAEQFRTLRTKLHRINGKQGNGKITLLTSSMPGEGKSMIACNLGAVMAASGRKTVILDMDFRKPQVAKFFNITSGIGLSNYLNGSESKEAILQLSYVHSDLFIINSGPASSNPSELLEKPALAELFSWLRICFDEIIIDTPPFQLVTDAMIISAHSDVNLYVVRQGYTYKSELRFINQLYAAQNLKNLYIVFNGVTGSGTYGYGKKYADTYYTTEKLN
jgi:tyrosine-protein kinase Etk/Wzc